MEWLNSVPEMFRVRASKSPEATAVRDGDRQLDYAGLDHRSARLARTLAGRGIGRGCLVAVLLDRSVDLVVALLAVLRSGAAYLPISPDDPAERVGFLLADAKPALVITSARHAGRMPWPDAGLVHQVDGGAESGNGSGDGSGDGSGRGPDGGAGSDGGAGVPLPSLTPADAAYVIYTSGSTGRPKGVVVEHGALSRYLEHVLATYPSVAGRALLHSSVSFDMAVTSLYGPLVAGGTVDLVDLRTVEADRAPAAALGGPSFLKVTPSHLAMLRALPAWCSPTDHLVIGGEALTSAQLRSWWDEHPAVTVVNEYGPTEATVGCCVHQARRTGAADGTRVPIGRPVSGSRLHVLDERLRPVSAGESGELYIAGEQLARGYLGRPATTAAAFVSDPFGADGERIYRSGDLVRELPDGSLEFLGRIDGQIKINGFRIEPGEVQAVLTGHGAVAQAFVTARGATDSQRLTAFVVPAAGVGRPGIGTDNGTGIDTGIDTDELRGFTAERLPAHMVPVDFVSLPALPLTANGKVDHDALPEPGPRVERRVGDDRTDDRRTHDAGAAMSAPEAILCRLVAGLTGVPAAGLDDDFFQLGGTSIAAARLVTRARREGVELTLAGVLKGRTIRRMLAPR